MARCPLTRAEKKVIFNCWSLTVRGTLSFPRTRRRPDCATRSLERVRVLVASGAADEGGRPYCQNACLIDSSADITATAMRVPRSLKSTSRHG